MDFKIRIFFFLNESKYKCLLDNTKISMDKRLSETSEMNAIGVKRIEQHQKMAHKSWNGPLDTFVWLFEKHMLPSPSPIEGNKTMNT